MPGKVYFESGLMVYMLLAAGKAANTPDWSGLEFVGVTDPEPETVLERAWETVLERALGEFLLVKKKNQCTYELLRRSSYISSRPRIVTDRKKSFIGNYLGLRRRRRLLVKKTILRTHTGS